MSFSPCTVRCSDKARHDQWNMSGSYMYHFQVGTMKRLFINLEPFSHDIAQRRLWKPHPTTRYSSLLQPWPLSDCVEKHPLLSLTVHEQREEIDCRVKSLKFGGVCYSAYPSLFWLIHVSTLCEHLWMQRVWWSYYSQTFSQSHIKTSYNNRYIREKLFSKEWKKGIIDKIL